MDANDSADKLVHDLLNVCTLPTLQVTIDDYQLTEKDFVDFRRTLDRNLPLLFDLWQEQKHRWTIVDHKTLDIRCKFVELIFEQNAPHTLYRTSNTRIQQQFSKAIKSYAIPMAKEDPKLVAALFKSYQQKLAKDVWKTNIGSANGFIALIRELSTEIPESLARAHDKCLFILSAATLMTETYGFKTQGIQLLNLLLTTTDKSLILELNLHDVIYHQLFQELGKITANKSTYKLLLDSLLQCSSIFPPVTDVTKWNRHDTLTEKLLNKIQLESHSTTKLCLIKYLLLFWNVEIRSPAIETLLLENDKHVDYTYEFGQLSNTKFVHSNFKWTLSLLKIFVFDGESITFQQDDVALFLIAFHIFYLINIAAIPELVNHSTILTNIEEFIATIIFKRILATLTREPSTRKIIENHICLILKTMQFHIKKDENLSRAIEKTLAMLAM